VLLLGAAHAGAGEAAVHPAGVDLRTEVRRFPGPGRRRSQRALDQAAAQTPAAIFAFDLLALNGKHVRRQPLLVRKAMLKRALKDSSRVTYLDHLAENGERLYRAAYQLGLEASSHRGQTARTTAAQRAAG
jgi:hypothetical protein